MNHSENIVSGCLRPNIMFCLILVICFSFSSKGQEAPKFNIKLKFSVQQGGLDNSLITITRNGSPYRVIDPSKGKYSIELELGSEFLFTFTKPGHITKSVLIDTHVPNGREKEEFGKFVADVGLELQPTEQIVTYSQPVGRIKYSNPSGDFDFDKDYTATAKEMEKVAKENPKPKPKEPTPNPRPVVTPQPTQSLPPSKPEPVVIKQPEYTPEPEKPKPIIVKTEAPPKPIVKNKTEKIIQKDRLKITIVTVNIDGVDYTYKREEYSWGGLYYYKDGKNITERSFEIETE
ncbi:MAG: hypothetical protein M3R27_11070, partial [Bacteroidota bacterium]|nr:hypothetical protein [Bacteroidota bacterium]